MTEAVTAAQLVYANVEAEESPRRRRGFQTLYYTKGALTGPEVLKLESRLTHEPRGHAGLRHLFTRTETGKYAVARFVPLYRTDRFGRAVRYFAHVLIFNEAEFRQLEYNPFYVIRARGCTFFQSLEQALDVGDRTSGDINEALVTPTPAAALDEPWSRWPEPGPLRDLLLAASQAKKLAAMRRTIALRGNPEAVTDFLDALFQKLPQSLCAGCTFDTYISDRMADKHGYWAVGLPEPPPRRPSLWPFSLDEPGFSPAIPLKAENGYERCIDYVFAPGTELPRTPAEALSGLDGVYELHQAVELRALAGLKNASPQSLDCYMAVNALILDRTFRGQLAQSLNCAEVPAWLLADATRWVNDRTSPAMRCYAMLRGPQPADLVTWVVFRLESRPWEAPGVNLDRLAERAIDPSHNRFLHIAARRRDEDWDRLSSYMRRLRDEGIDEAERERLYEWIFRSLGLDIRMGIYQEDGFLAFACVARCGPLLLRMLSQFLDLDLDLEANDREPLPPMHELHTKLVWMDVARPDLWIEMTRTRLNDRNVCFGLCWAFQPTADGFLLAHSYRLTDDNPQNEMLVLDWFQSPPACLTKVSVLAGSRRGRTASITRRRLATPSLRTYELDDRKPYWPIFKALCETTAAPANA